MNASTVNAYLRVGAGQVTERVGPFLATFTPGNDHPMRNYAIPDDDAQPSRAEVEQLIEAYRRRGPKPRLEYADRAAPDLEMVLVESGFEVEAHLVLMACLAGQGHVVGASSDFTVALAQSDDDHAEAMAVAGEAYGEPLVRPDRAAIAARRQIVRAGAAVVLARHLRSGDPAGSGLFTVPRAGISELAVVGTREPYRHRGVASAVTSLLVQIAFEGDVEALWLTPEDADSQGIFSRVGFVPLEARMIHISIPSPP